MQWGLIAAPINFLGEPWNARWSVIAANVWRGIPFVAISLLAGLQTIPQSLNEAAALDGATSWQRFRRVTFPLLTPIIAVVMTFSVLFTFTDFQLIYVLTRGGPVNATHLMATLSFQRAIPGGQLGEGAAIAVAMIPFLLGGDPLLASSACSGGSGSREGATDAPRGRRPRSSWRGARRRAGRAGADRRHRRHGAVQHADAADPRHLPAAGGLRLRAALPLLLDGDHRHQAEPPADQLQRLQPVLGGRADARAHQVPVPRDLLSGLALEHDPRLGRLDLHRARSPRSSPPTPSSASASPARG